MKKAKKAAKKRTKASSRPSSSRSTRSARIPRNEGEALGALLDRIQRKGERRIKEAIANAVGPRLQEGLSGAFEGLQILDQMLGDDDEDDDEDDEDEEE